MKNETLDVPMARVEVTQDDIDRGVPDRRCDCPIALALHRLTGKHWNVFQNCVRFNSLTIALPMEARFFIRCFDRKEQVDPFAFELPI